MTLKAGWANGRPGEGPAPSLEARQKLLIYAILGYLQSVEAQGQEAPDHLLVTGTHLTIEALAKAGYDARLLDVMRELDELDGVRELCGPVVWARTIDRLTKALLMLPLQISVNEWDRRPAVELLLG